MQRGRIEKPVLLRRRFIPAPTTLSKTNKIIATLYSSRISDFFPTYFTPSGSAIMTAARKEKTRNQNKNKRSDVPWKIGMNARNGSVVKKHNESARVFP